MARSAALAAASSGVVGGTVAQHRRAMGLPPRACLWETPGAAVAAHPRLQQAVTDPLLPDAYVTFVFGDGCAAVADIATGRVTSVWVPALEPGYAAAVPSRAGAAYAPGSHRLLLPLDLQPPALAPRAADLSNRDARQLGASLGDALAVAPPPVQRHLAVVGMGMGMTSLGRHPARQRLAEGRLVPAPGASALALACHPHVADHIVCGGSDGELSLLARWRLD
jgi:hypothetical protein